MAYKTEDDKKKAYEDLLNCTYDTKAFLAKDFPEEEFLPTNTEFDLLCGGLAKNALNIIAGATANGKSLSTLMLSYNAGKTNAVLYISCENRERTDWKRVKALSEKYGIAEFFFYVNIRNVKDKMSAIEYCLNRGSFDLVALDGVQFVLKTGKTGGEQFNIGDEFTKCVVAKVQENDNGTTLLMSWQLNREGMAAKSLDEMNPSMITTSYSLATITEYMYAVKKNPKDQTIFIGAIKNRDIIDSDNGKKTVQLTKGKDFTLKSIEK